MSGLKDFLDYIDSTGKEKNLQGDKLSSWLGVLVQTLEKIQAKNKTCEKCGSNCFVRWVNKFRDYINITPATGVRAFFTEEYETVPRLLQKLISKHEVGMPLDIIIEVDKLVAGEHKINWDTLTLEVTDVKSKGAGMVEAKVDTEATIKKLKAVDFRFEGNQVIIPESMSFDDVIKWAQIKKDEDNKVMVVNEVIDCHPLEGAIALKKTLDRKFGFSSMINTPGFFKDNPPLLFALEVAYGKTEQVMWGRFVIPGVDGWLQTNLSIKDNNWCFLITGEIKQRFKNLVKAVADETRDTVRDESIYKGKAFYLQFPEDMKQFNPNDAPKFMDAESFDTNSLVLPEEVDKSFRSQVIAPITRTKEFRLLGIPLKTGVLLEGPPGVGKTLAAHTTAKYAVDNGWTFIYLKQPEDLERAIRFAAKYQPAVIFLEDVDRVLSGKRDESMDTILNVLDGIDTKSGEILTVVTTNHVENIEKVCLRPGRFDAIISVRAPDKVSTEKLIRKYAAGTLPDSENISDIAEKLSKASTTPAVIHEVVKRAKRSAVYFSNSELRSKNDLKLSADALRVATDSMITHIELLKEDEELKDRDAMATYFAILGSQFKGALALATNPAIVGTDMDARIKRLSKNIS